MNLIQFMPLAVNKHLELVANLRNTHQHTLYLGRKYINTPHYQHIIGPAHNLIQPCVSTPALAFILHDTGNVTSTVAYQRHSLLGQRGQHQFTLLPRCHALPIRVQYLNKEMVIPYMKTVLFLAFESHARSEHLRQAIGIIGFDIQRILQFLSGIGRPGFGTETTSPQRQPVNHIQFPGCLCQVQGIGRGAVQGRNPEVYHHLKLVVGIACTAGYCSSTDTLDTEMYPKPCDKEVFIYV